MTGQGFVFFAAGAVAGAAARPGFGLVRGWLVRLRDRAVQQRRREPQRREADRPREPSLAELLAETGWRINPREHDRELARKTIPLGLIVVVAVLFLFAHSGLGWLLLGFVLGVVSWGALLAFFRQRGT